jgi:hypothetical protein
VDKEKRKGDISIPVNFEKILNEAQRQALPGIECQGWELRFLREPLFQAPVLVVQNSNDGRTGIMDEAGRIRIQTTIKVREQTCQTLTPPPAKPLVWTK